MVVLGAEEEAGARDEGLGMEAADGVFGFAVLGVALLDVAAAFGVAFGLEAVLGFGVSFSVVVDVFAFLAADVVVDDEDDDLVFLLLVESLMSTPRR